MVPDRDYRLGLLLVPHSAHFTTKVSYLGVEGGRAMLNDRPAVRAIRAGVSLGSGGVSGGLTRTGRTVGPAMPRNSAESTGEPVASYMLVSERLRGVQFLSVVTIAHFFTFLRWEPTTGMP